MIRPRLKHVRVGAVAIATVMALATASCGGDEASSDVSSADTSAEDALRGQTIRVVVSESVGGGTDLWGRFIADELSDRLPGDPNVTVTNVEGQAGMNNVYSAPSGQFVFGVAGSARDLYTTSTEPGAEHDPMKLRVLGSQAPDPRVLYGPDIGYDDIEDMMGSSEPPLRKAGTVGGPEGVLGEDLMLPWVCDTLDLPCEMIDVASDSNADEDLMLERGEVNLGITSLRSALRDHEDQLLDGSYRLWALYEVDSLDEAPIPDGMAAPPLLTDVLPPESIEDYEKLLPMIGSGPLGKVLWSGPNVDEAVVDAVRAAYDEVLADADLKADLEQLFGAAIDPISGADAEELIREATSTYSDNSDFYKELQDDYWENYWG